MAADPDVDMPNRVKRKDDDLVAREIAGETIVVPIRGELADMDSIYVLNPVAEYVWWQLDGEKSLDEVLAGVLSTFDVARQEAVADLEAFVVELLDAGLVEPAR